MMQIVAKITAATKKFIRGSLSRLGYRISRISAEDPVRHSAVTKLVSQNIPGWFSSKEAEELYVLAATTAASRILEVGHFLGRSTSAICEGIRDSCSAAEFNSFDLGFANADEFVAHYERVHDTVSSAVPPLYESLVFAENKTTSEIAKANLSKFDLDKYVHLISGDFTLLSHGHYGLIFCDAMHDHGEVKINLPHLISASANDCVWAFHDMNDELIAQIIRDSSARLIRVVDTLGVFRFKRQPAVDSR